jgi:hypothetical protein
MLALSRRTELSRSNAKLQGRRFEMKGRDAPWFA